MQIRELRDYAARRKLGIVEEFIDHASGAKENRPQLDRLLRAIRNRTIDTVLVWKFDRFARSTRQLINALEEFRHLDVDFISITEQIDTSSPLGKAMFTVISAIAEFERSLISERVRAGIAKARAQGKPHGRLRIDDQKIALIRQLRKEKLSLAQVAKKVGVSRQTVANYS